MNDNRRKQRAFDACLEARNEAQRQLRSTSEDLERQRAENVNVYGLHSRLGDQLARVQLEKDKELKKLASECELFRAISESLEAELLKYRTMLAECHQKQRAHTEEIQRERGERNARLALKDQQIDTLQRKHETMSGDIARLESERDTRVRELHEMKQAVADKLVEQSEETVEEVRALEARYAHLMCENEAKLAQLAREKEAKAAALDRDKNAFISKLCKQRDQYKEMANSLRDGRLPAAANPSTLLRSMEPSTEQAPTTIRVLPPHLDEDELQFLSLD